MFLERRMLKSYHKIPIEAFLHLHLEFPSSFLVLEKIKWLYLQDIEPTRIFLNSLYLFKTLIFPFKIL